MCLAWTILVGKSIVFFSFIDSNDWFISMFCLSWTILVGILPMLYVMNKNGWYITRFCLLWTVMVGISPSFFLSWTKLVGISTGLVCCGQYWLLYQPVLSVMDNIGW